MITKKKQSHSSYFLCHISWTKEIGENKTRLSAFKIRRFKVSQVGKARDCLISFLYLYPIFLPHKQQISDCKLSSAKNDASANEYRIT